MQAAGPAPGSEGLHSARPDEGYCQAQAPIAAVLLMHMPAEVSSH